MKNKYLFISKIIGVFVLVAFCLGISDYASAAGSQYSTAIKYDAAQADIPAHFKAEGKARNAVIYVTEFIDARQLDDKKEIGRVRERNDNRNPICAKDALPAKTVADGIQVYLKKAGYKVDDKIAQWDLKESTIKRAGGKLLIGGTIEEMEVTCWRGVFSQSYKTNVKLTIVFANPANGTILYRSRVESSSSKDDAFFSEEQIGRRLSSALGDALEKIFKDKDTAQKIKEVLDK